MILNKMNNTLILLALTFSGDIAGSVNSFHLPALYIKNQGKEKDTSVLILPSKHSLTKMQRQLYPEKQPLHSTKKVVCKPLWYTCILSSEEIWSYQSTMTSAVSKMIAQWMSPLAGFLKVVETQFEYTPACAMLCTLLEQSPDSISKNKSSMLSDGTL